MNRFLVVVALLLVAAVSMPLARLRAQTDTSIRLTASSTISIAGGTPAVIVSAVPGKIIKPLSMKLATIGTGGIVTFYDGADATKPLPLNVYCPASTSVNDNVDVPPELLQRVCANTTAGNALCAQLSGCTLCYTVVYQTY